MNFDKFKNHSLPKLWRLFSLVLAILLVIQVPAQAALLPITAKDMQSIYLGENYRDSEEPTSPCGDTTADTTTTGGSVYMLGDSITVGATTHLTKLFTEKGYTIGKINGVSGRAIATPGSGNETGYQAIDNDAEQIRAASAIIVALGTNSTGATEGGVKKMINNIRALGLKSDAQIFWVNIFSVTPHKERINKLLLDLKDKDGMKFNIIDTTGAQIALASDNVHPTSAGYLAFATTVANALATRTATSSGTGTLPGNNNFEKVANFFLAKGVSKEIIAGILGNITNESGGAEPKKLQFVRTDRAEEAAFTGKWDDTTPTGRKLMGKKFIKFVDTSDGPKISSEQVIVGPDTEGVGFGIVQWTPARKIFLTAHDAGISYEEIDTLEFQLEFLWNQLQGTAWRGNPQNLSREKKAWEKISAATTVEEAAFAFGRYYERFASSLDPNSSSYTARIGSALTIYKDLFGMNASLVSSTCGSVAGANGWGLPGEANPMTYYSQLREDASPKDPAVTSYWGQYPYGEGTIDECGCGPTSFAMAVTTLTGDTSATPDKVAAWAAENNYRNDSSACAGSSWWWVDGIGTDGIPAPGSPASKSMEKWRVRASQITLDQVATALQQGKIIIASVGAGSALLSKGGNGHLLILRAVTSDGKFLFADPSDGNTKRNNGGDGTNPDIFKGTPGGSSHTPLDAATVSSGLKGLFAVERMQ